MDDRPPLRFLFGDRPDGARVLNQLRRLQRRQLGDEAPLSEVEALCELCEKGVSEGHRHLVQTEERRILCVCESCWALRGGEIGHRPAGTRTLWLADFVLSDETWARLQVPIGLAFFFVSGAAGCAVGLYPSPAGATECEIDLEAWRELVRANPVLRDLEPDAEALLVNRLEGARQVALAPIDECYRLVGRIKSSWEGISGGPGLRRAVAEHFTALEARARRP